MSKIRMWAWGAWLIASVFYAYQYILRVMPNIMLDDFMRQFGMDAATFGQFSGLYYTGYALMHIPVGIMLDRFGPRKVMPCCILLSVAGLIPLLFATSFTLPIVGRFLIGLGSSGAILGVFKIIRMTFSEKLFPRMLSLSVTIGLIGAIYGGGPVDYMRETLGYQMVTQIFALAGIALACVTYWIVPEMEKSARGNVFAQVKEVLKNRRVILSCLSAGLMVGPLEGFADVWGTSFLKQVYGFDGVLAASLPSLLFIGMTFGGPLLSLLAERVGNYLGIIAGAGIVMAAGFGILLFTDAPSALIAILFILVGICCAYQILAIYKASTFVREEVAGLTTAVANMIIMVFGYAFHATMGGIINYMGGTSSSQALVYGVAVIPLALCLGSGGFLALFFEEKRLSFKEQKPNL